LALLINPQRFGSQLRESGPFLRLVNFNQKLDGLDHVLLFHGLPALFLQLNNFIQTNEVLLSLNQVIGKVKILINLDEFNFGEEGVVFFEGITDGTFGEVVFGISFQDVKVENLIGLGVFEGREEGMCGLDVLVSLQNRAIELIDNRVQIGLLNFHLNKLSERLKILL
jgi:hypothetical protein